MIGERIRQLAKQIPGEWLPFADVASADLPLPRLLRLSLFKVTMGMTTALLIGTLNRVMIVELGVAASLVSLMLALPMLVAPFRAVTGYQSDTHRSAFGWKRVPFMWGGSLIQFFGLAFMPFALLNLSGQAQNPLPTWLVEGVVALSFLMVGAGLQTSQTAGLALATDQASEETRPRVVALMYVMLLAGAVGGSLIYSVLLADFRPQRLIQVVQGTGLVVLMLNAFALWKQESRNRERAAAMKLQKQEPFKQVWARFIHKPLAKRFLWTTFLGTLAFNMQDIVLEPYGGEILHLSVGATSALTAMLAGGGLFAVGTLFAAMRMEGGGLIGLALGAWGAVQSTGAGLAMFFGGALRDGVTQLTASGAYGAAFAAPATGYSVVYHVEMLLLFITLVAIGPLVRRRRTHPLAPHALAGSQPS